MDLSLRTRFSSSRSARLGLRLLGISICAVSVAYASPWSKVKAPAPGPTQVIGSTSNGCLGGAETLPRQGKGFVSIRRYRNRYYGHPDLLALIRDMGASVSRRTDQLMMVGDLSQPRGGLMSSSHRSHQNGLDVDIWFRLARSPGSADREHPEERDPKSMVAPGGLRVNASWGEDQQFLIKTAAKDRRVDRIFVNPAIKQALCQTERGDREWLRKLRPWWGHDAHFHVRLRCPPGNPACEQQAPIPAGDGCGAELAWWFSEEARSPKKSGKPKSTPPMPAACQALLSGY
jgi:penicillin-insensitive murein endopeptidase